MPIIQPPGATEFVHRATIVGQSAFDLLREEALKTPIVTFCADIDAMLGGGIQIGTFARLWVCAEA